MKHKYGIEREIVKVARICHEANRAYCVSIGDNSQLPWSESPSWMKESAINGVRFHYENREATASSSHENWYKEKEENGWKYGPIKDPIKREHPCFVSYDQLPVEQQTKDHIFRSICHAMFSVYLM